MCYNQKKRKKGEMDLELLYDENHPKDKGYWQTSTRVKESAKGTIDDVTKFAYNDDDYEDVAEWHEYTEEELAEQAEAEKKAAQEQSDREFLDTAPGRVSAIESGVDDSYDAIAELGNVVNDVEVTLDDVMDAIAELGTIVEGSNG